MYKNTHIVYKCVCTHTIQTHRLVINCNHLCLKNRDHWSSTVAGHFSRFIMDIQIQIAFTFIRSHASYSSISAISHVLSSKGKSQSTCSYNHKAFEGIRMHIDNAGPWAITGLIFLSDKQSASLWAFSWKPYLSLPYWIITANAENETAKRFVKYIWIV